MEEISKLSKRKVASIRGIGNKNLAVIESVLRKDNLFFHGEVLGEQKLEDIFKNTGYGIQQARIINILENANIVTIEDVLLHTREYYLSLYGINNTNIKYIEEALALINKKLI